MDYMISTFVIEHSFSHSHNIYLYKVNFESYTTFIFKYMSVLKKILVFFILKFFYNINYLFTKYIELFHIYLLTIKDEFKNRICSIDKFLYYYQFFIYLINEILYLKTYVKLVNQTQSYVKLFKCDKKKKKKKGKNDTKLGAPYRQYTNYVLFL